MFANYCLMTGSVFCYLRLNLWALLGWGERGLRPLWGWCIPVQSTYRRNAGTVCLLDCMVVCNTVHTNLIFYYFIFVIVYCGYVWRLSHTGVSNLHFSSTEIHLCSYLGIKVYFVFKYASFEYLRAIFYNLLLFIPWTGYTSTMFATNYT